MKHTWLYSDLLQALKERSFDSDCSALCGNTRLEAVAEAVVPVVLIANSQSAENEDE